MTRLHDALENAVGTIAPNFAPSHVTARARQRRVRRRIACVMAIVVVVASVAVVATRHSHRATDVEIRPTTTNNDVLVFSDLYDGVVTLDLHNRVAQRRPVQGARAGDQPFHILRVDRDVVIGWGDVYAAPLGGGASRLLGEGVDVPAIEPGAVWLTSFGVVPTTTERLVDMRGHVLLSGRAPSNAYPVTGIPGGLVFGVDNQLAFWDARTETFTRKFGTRLAVGGPASRTTFAWCADCTKNLELMSIRDGVNARIARPADTASFNVMDARFSPDGKLLAMPMQGRDEQGGDLLIIDVASGTVRVHVRNLYKFTGLGWSEDGARLYISSATGNSESAHLLEYDVHTGAIEDLPYPRALQAGSQFIVVSQADIARSLDERSLTTPELCVPPTIQPSGRDSPCAFHY